MLLLDTNIVSFIFKGHTLGEKYLPDLQGQPLAISAMTVAELLEWAIIHQWGQRKRVALQMTIASYTVLPLDEPVWFSWATIRANCRTKGIPIEVADAWIAATAIHHHVSLVTHNSKDFTCVEGLQLISYA
ncbi:PIN domain-containing protein [Anaerolineales bacterium HSG6]|nr:PIN domain-containing protein [Anaerolineales bacterium HSG6]